MKYWIAAALIAASLSHPVVRIAASEIRWAGAQRPPYLTPDHKPTAKLPMTKLA